MANPAADILINLARLAVTGDDGHRYIRRCDALRVIGVSSAAANYWVRKGYVHPLRLRVPRRFVRAADRGGRGSQIVRGSIAGGGVTAWRLDEVITRVSKLRQAKSWTNDDRLRLEGLIASGMTYHQAARAMGRTYHSVSKVAVEIGAGFMACTDKLTTGDLERLMRIRHGRLNHWISRGLPTHRRTLSAERVIHMIEPHDVLAWLRDDSQRHLLGMLGLDALSRLERCCDKRPACSSSRRAAA